MNHNGTPETKFFILHLPHDDKSVRLRAMFNQVVCVSKITLVITSERRAEKVILEPSSRASGDKDSERGFFWTADHTDRPVGRYRFNGV